MARILAIDTTGESGSLAALEGGVIVAESLLQPPQTFSNTLFTHVRELLDRAGWNIAEVDVFATAAGPGSFTGVRIGIAAVKGLAEATGRRVASVSNLEALAFFGSAPLRAAVLDARRGQVYAALFDAQLNTLRPAAVTLLPDWLAGVPTADLEFLTHDPGLVRPALASTPFESVTVTEVPHALARAVAHIAACREPVDAAAIDANYVRRCDAELFWKDPR
ncbi:MAG TPA: tRNA (adenosine(37)-N6)-threonylcarbamoyltransferase complex dimerization subunit type 1 TsaB [Bryobacteraceae bacterium]|nr:tRNA (adenosine(37)-N6)-threonylcarbamoyltransferase complex dimerization subunit type 1 TsaB [Bryobacteraceae bacterium]